MIPDRKFAVPLVMRLKQLSLLLCAALFLTVSCQAAKVLKNSKKVPDWVMQGSRAATEVDGGDAGYVLLHDSSEIEVDAIGRARVVTRQILKITGLKGRERALCSAYYTTDSEKVDSINAWMTRRDGSIIQYDKKDVVDSAALSSGGIVSSGRIKSINAVGDARIGCVFASETVTEEWGTSLSWFWSFSGEAPSVMSTIAITFPEGWSVRPHFANMDAFSPVRSGSTRRWTLHNLKPVPDEDWAPTQTAQFVEINLQPPVGSPLREKFLSASSWKEYSMYHTSEYLNQDGDRTRYASKVEELTDSQGSRLEKIRKLASFAQEVNYVSIALDLGRGGGWRPRLASEVCESNYGDCKDKSNMLCHMLAEIGVTAYPLVVNANLRHEVDASRPSGFQFNHCIAAIAMESGFDGGSIIEHPTLGRLLIFDPTDELTALGDLNKNLQGSKGLLLAGELGGLVELPTIEPAQNVTKRDVQAELFPNGALVAKLKEHSIGQMGRPLRSALRYVEKGAEFKRSLMRRISSSIASPQVSDPVVEDNLSGNAITLQIDFGTQQYGQAMGGALLMFKPVLLDRLEGVPFGVEKERELDLILSPSHTEETYTIYIPVGYRVSEYIEKVALSEDFGEYSNTVSIEGDTIVCRRKMRIERARLPAERFEEAKAFYQKMAKADQAVMVLEKI